MASKPKKSLHFQISGFEGCPFFEGALSTITMYKNNVHGKTHIVKVSVKKITYDKWPTHLEKQCALVIPSHKKRARDHKTSPFIICNSHFVGGYDQLANELQKSSPFIRC